MTNQHDPKACLCLALLDFGNGQTGTINSNVPLLDDIRDLSGVEELEIVPDGIAIGGFGSDGRCGVYVALVVRN